MSFASQVIVGALACVCLVGGGCAETSAPRDPQLNGSFALTQVNGRTLPDTEAIAPSSVPGYPTCAILGTSGTLVLDAVTGKFTIILNAKNACAAGEWVLESETGTYSQEGSTLSLREPFPDHTANLAGQVYGQNIVIHGVYHDYSFAR